MSSSRRYTTIRVKEKIDELGHYDKEKEKTHLKISNVRDKTSWTLLKVQIHKSWA
jgi:hypothetical protein